MFAISRMIVNIVPTAQMAYGGYHSIPEIHNCHVGQFTNRIYSIPYLLAELLIARSSSLFSVSFHPV